MGVREFASLLAGLSEASAYRAAISRDPAADLSGSVEASSQALREMAM